MNLTVLSKLVHMRALLWIVVAAHDPTQGLSEADGHSLCVLTWDAGLC